MKIWRLTINTSAQEGVDPRKFCIEKNFLGFGWGVGATGPLDWSEYEKLGTEIYYNKVDRDNGWWPAANAIHNRMEVGDLCWTRDWDGRYFLGRVEGPWKYCTTEEHISTDVVNVRPCRWFYIGTDDAVPGKVLNSFRTGRTLQAVHDRTTNIYSKLIYNSAEMDCKYELPIENMDLDLFSLISPEDCEDIVGIYLQEVLGYRLIPSTCRASTAVTEFVLRKRDRKALVQVKQGYVPLDRKNYKIELKDPSEWFLFTTCGEYQGEEVEHVHCLDPEELRNFVYTNVSLMSDRVQKFAELSLEKNLKLQSSY